jgi:hypothetical protein
MLEMAKIILQKCELAPTFTISIFYNPVLVQVTRFLTSPFPLARLGRAHVSVQNALRHKRVVAQSTPNAAPVFGHVVVERFLVRVNLVANSASRIARVRVQVI